MPRLRRFYALVAAILGCLLIGAFAPAVTADPGDPSTTSTTATATSSTAGPTSSTSSPPAASTTTVTTTTTSSATPGSGSTTTSASSQVHQPQGGITEVTPPPSTASTTPADLGTSTTVAGDGTQPDIQGDSGGNVPRGVIPADAQAVISSYPRSPANNTSKLIAALQPLIDMGVPQDQVYALGFGRFPVQGAANFVDDWLFPRWDGSFHFHHGTDIFAPGGTPVRAVADGTLRQDTDRLGGTVVYVKEPSGTYYYYAHLSGYVEGQVTGQQVRTGEIIGYVGNSGDASGGPTHCHFQVHPDGGEPVDPKSYLDDWLAEALANVPQLLASVRAAKVPNVAPVLRPQMVPAAAFAAPAVPARSQLLWASSANPQGGTLQLAEAVAGEAARSVDWSAERRQQEQQELSWIQAQVWARSVVMPLLPVGLHVVADPTPQVTLVDHR